MSNAVKFDCTRLPNCSIESCTQQMGCSKPSSDRSGVDGVEEWIASGSTLFGSLNSFNLVDDEAGFALSEHQTYEHRHHLQEFSHLDDLYLDVLSPPFQSCEEEIRRIVGVEFQLPKLVEPKKSRQNIMSPSEPFDVLRKYSRRHSIDGRISGVARARNAPLSVEEIIKLAAETFVHSRCISEDRSGLFLLDHPYPTSVLTLCNEDSEGVLLVQNLLSCAEKVAQKKYECAIRFLKACSEMSSATGTPMQRLAFYFSEALDVKIANEAWKRKTPAANPPLEPAKFVNSMPTYFRQFPLTQITNLVGSHTILRYLGDARKIHVVDIEIRSGVQWIQLMQDVAARNEHPKIKHLRITAVGTRSKPILEETGRQLASFAESVKLKFTFKVVMVDDILDLNLDLFKLKPDESVVVYASYSFVMMIGRSDRLRHLMGVITDLSPCVMIVTEMEANCNSPQYIERFVESLFLFGAFFDSMGECMTDQEVSRMDIESTLYRSSIKNVLAAQGEEMVLRHVPINVWRAFFASFRLMEVEVSFSSLNQAKLLLRPFSYGSSITLCKNGGCLTVGWKGIALTSVSAWRVEKH